MNLGKVCCSLCNQEDTTILYTIDLYHIIKCNLVKERRKKLLPFRITTFTELANHLRKRNYPRSFLNPSQREETLKILRECFPDSLTTRTKQANLICEHIFGLLGNGH